MKRKIVEAIYGIIILMQFLTAYVYLSASVKKFNFDNISIFISAAIGLYFSIEFGNEFIDKWGGKNERK